MPAAERRNHADHGSPEEALHIAGGLTDVSK
jgi:hypothetical protein